MTPASSLPSDHDAVVVQFQLERTPRSPWRVASRCSFGYPSSICSPSVLDDGDRFPTMYWLTCSHLVRDAGRRESSQMTDEWTRRLREDASLRDAVLGVEERLRRERALAAGGTDPCASTGIAGQRDSLAVKCLHAHVALALAGMNDPIGESIVNEAGECSDGECGRCSRDSKGS